QSPVLVQGRVAVGGFVFFFFQAEDGIRDYKVTGVQTCALPILGRSRDSDIRVTVTMEPGVGTPERGGELVPFVDRLSQIRAGCRSEERRVGKECRSRWWEYDEKRKVEGTCAEA